MALTIPKRVLLRNSSFYTTLLDTNLLGACAGAGWRWLGWAGVGGRGVFDDIIGMHGSNNAKVSAL